MCLFFFFCICLIQMKFPEVAHREEARQELRVKMPLGKINSSSAVFSVPWQVL